MNREIFSPLSIGVITIWIIMTFKIFISYYILIIIFSVLISLYTIYKVKFFNNAIIIIIALFIGVFSVNRVEIESKYNYIPTLRNSITNVDVTVIKDSIPVSGGYLSSGLVFRVNSRQHSIISNSKVTIFSKNSLYIGQVFRDIDVKFKDDSLFINIKDHGELVYESRYYKFRSKILNGLIGRTSSPLLIALITGNKSLLDLDIIELFRKNGCSHILALSGFHVGIITVIIILFLRVFIWGNSIYILSSLTLILYLLFVGPTASLIRSILMFIIASIFKIKQQRISIYKILIISFYIILIFIPREFETLSFKLSYLALFGIVVLGPELEKLFIFKKIPKVVRVPFTTSLSALISTSIVIIPVFGVLYPSGLFVSILITPIITLFMWTGVLSLIVPKLDSVVKILEKSIFYLLDFFSKGDLELNCDINSLLIPLILASIPVILVILKIYRRADARRFNLKFKL